MIFIVGNKTDKAHQSRRVTTSEGKTKAGHLNAHFIETSAKDDVNVKELFNQIATHLPQNKPAQQPTKSGGRVELSNSGGGKASKNCC